MAILDSIQGNNFVICGFEGDQIAQSVADGLQVKLITISNGQFNDTSSNIKIDISNKNAFDNKTVHLIASNCRTEKASVNETTMQLFLAINAANQAKAKDVCLYVPHLGYARQDRASQPGEPGAAQMVLRMFESAGAKKITVLDIHNEDVSDSLQNAKLINKFAMALFAQRFKEMKERGVDLSNIVIVAPDRGARDRAHLFQKAMIDIGFTGVDFAYFDKSRDYAEKGQVQSMDLRDYVLQDGTVLSGEDAKERFRGKTTIVVDDMADTCGTMLCAIEQNMIKRYGAKEAYAAITHGVFSGNALEKIARTEKLKAILVTNSVPLRGDKPDNLEIVDCSQVFIQAIADSFSK